MCQIGGNDRPIPLRGMNRLQRKRGCRFAQSRKDSAGMKPARARLAEYLFPIKVAWSKLARGGITPVRNAHRSANPEATLGKIEPIPHRPADAIVGHPLNEHCIDSALQNEILDQ